MCGIAGILSINNYNQKLINSMLSSIQHRGPDNTGIYKDEIVHLGMNRLSIIDIKGGNQPMISNDQNVILIFNGEIYNYKELKKELSEYYTFKSNSDTEVILAGYKKKGIDFFSKLNGIYSIAIWDKLKKKLYLIRDPMGVKPLFYLKKNSSIYFSSEIKSFTNTYIENNVNIDSVIQCMASGYVFNPTSSISGCIQVAPGTLLEIDTKANIKEINFYSIENILLNKINNSEKNIENIYNKTKVKFVNSISRQTMSDVPIGILLSSGMDSMTILSVLKAQNMMENITTFTAYYENDDYNEIDEVKEITNLWNIKNKSIKITADEVYNNLDSIFYTYDNLELFPVNVSKFLVSNLASNYVKVLLSGSGGDEVFLGYPTHTASNIINKYFIPKLLSKGIEKVSNQLKNKNLYLSLNEKLNRFAIGSQQKLELAHFLWRFVFLSKEMKRIFIQPYNFTEEYIFQNQKKLFENAEISKMDFLNKLSIIDLKTFLLDHGLMLWDKAGMANSVEVRVPLIDLKLLEFLYSINSNLRTKPLVTKKFLKNTFKSLIPPTITNLPKKGFRVPVIDWLNNPKIHNKLKDLSLTLPNDIFNKQYIEFLWKEFDNEQYSHAYKLWIISSIGGWSNAHNIKWVI